MDLGDDRVHLGGGEGPAGCRVSIPRRSQMQEQGGGRLVVSGFKDQHAVVIAQGPISLIFTPIFFPAAFRAAARCVLSSMALMPCCVNLMVVMKVAIELSPIKRVGNLKSVTSLRGFDFRIILSRPCQRFHRR